MIERKQNGGRIEREIELGEERRWERHRDTRTQGQNGTNSNQIFIKQLSFPLLHSPLYRVGKIESWE